MPRKVQVLLLLLALLTLSQVVVAATGGETSQWVSVALYVAFLYGLIAGSEGARAILRFFAGVGVFFAGLSLFLIVASGLMATGLGTLGLAVSAYALAVNGFMFWCLGQEDVKAWIVARKLRGAL